MINSPAQRYLPVISELLSKHRLKVPDGTAETLAKTILKCHVLKTRTTSQKAANLPRRKRLSRALTHARKLLEYAQRKPSHRNSVPNRVRSLRTALDNGEVVMWLALSTPPIDIPTLLTLPDNGSPAKADLEALVRALEHNLSTKGKRTGRRTGRPMTVVVGGCIAWVRAGRRLSYFWYDAKERAGGSLAAFVRDFLKVCGLQMSEAALHSELRDAVLYIKHHPNLQAIAPD